MFKKIFKHELLDKKLNVIGINKEVQAVYVWNLFCELNETLVIVTNTLYEANTLYKSLSYYSSEDILLFPADDFLMNEIAIMSPDLMVRRIETLNEISSDIKKRIVITNLMGFLRFLPTKKLWDSLKINIKINDSIDRNELIEKLDLLGYQKESLVTKTG